jgi:hypothetical protein
MISAYAFDIAIIIIDKGNLKRVIKMVETEFGKLILKLNKKKYSIIRIMKKDLKKAENKEDKEIKFMN